MMYSEFIEGTGCKDSKYNYGVFRNLEIMYMNSDLSKEQIYEYGKKLVDNSKSEEQLRLERETRIKIDNLRDQIKLLQKDIEFRKNLMDSYDEDWNKEMRRYIKRYRGEIKECRNRIAELKWILA